VGAGGCPLVGLDLPLKGTDLPLQGALLGFLPALLLTLRALGGSMGSNGRALTLLLRAAPTSIPRMMRVPKFSPRAITRQPALLVRSCMSEASEAARRMRGLPSALCLRRRRTPAARAAECRPDIPSSILALPPPTLMFELRSVQIDVEAIG